MIHRIRNKIKGISRKIVHRNNMASRKRRSAIKNFCEKVGLLYFGSVDQHHDDHHIIRGLTASADHQDEHYAVGTCDGYDVRMVNRVDVAEDVAGRLHTHSWLIFEIDLKQKSDIPHVFMGAHDHKNSPYSKLFTTHTSMQPVPLGTFMPYSQDFTSRYSLFALASHFIQVERYFTADVTKVIAAHFWPLSVEVYEGALYIYADNQLVSIRLLETMLKNGLWLAKQLDQPIAKLD